MLRPVENAMSDISILPRVFYTVAFWNSFIWFGMAVVLLHILTCFFLKWCEKAGVDVTFFKKCPLEPNPFFPNGGAEILQLAMLYVLVYLFVPCVVIAFLKS